jgi:Asp-tRNA(Asn)/Glu-tRNA(Gln) amidotransferase A subunit family amidase
MAVVTSSIAMLRQRYLSGEANPLAELDAALARANSNAGHNVYLAHDPDWSRNEARNLRREDAARKPLWGVPVALKDCFDLTGFTTSCGSAFYRDDLGIAKTDSAVAARLRSAGAVITGKTHLHQLAYGITGENRDFGDCLQPLNPAHLTGGSSSGAAASVQEGSALAAIGTDTGGSIRVPAALCGLAGYRCSITCSTPQLWRGGYHLAASFDTLGWLYRDLADGPALGHALFDLPPATPPALDHLRIGTPAISFLHDCEPDVLASLHLWQSRLQSHGATLSSFDASYWEDSTSIYAHIQASEAAALHRGHFHHFEPIIAERLAWGESLTAAELIPFHNQLEAFRASTYALFQNCDCLLFPCAPVSSIAAGADHTQTRARMLRYTTPMSLAGLPVVTLPSFSSEAPQGGLQLVGPLGSDAALLALSASLSEMINNDQRASHPPSTLRTTPLM